MPRYTLSANSSQFEVLFGLLDRQDETSEDVWSLIRMLATNQHLYEQVLSLIKIKDEQGKIDWSMFFEGSSVYK